MELLKDAVRRTYGKKGEDIVEKNCAAIDAGMQGIRKIELKQEWLSCESDDLFGKKICAKSEYVSDYVNHIQRAVNAFEGNKLPVSAFLEYASGAVPVSYTHLDVYKRQVFMINCQWSDEELEHHLNAEAKKYIADRCV